MNRDIFRAISRLNSIDRIRFEAEMDDYQYKTNDTGSLNGYFDLYGYTYHNHTSGMIYGTNLSTGSRVCLVIENLEEAYDH